MALVTSEVAVAGMLQPAYEVAGDTFDYALDPDGLHVAVVDSVGHDLHSSMISHLVQGSLRNSRRNGLDVVESYEVADAALAAMYPDQRFATAAFGHLGLDTGRFRWIMLGHPPPLLVRGGRVVGEAPARPSLPSASAGARPRSTSSCSSGEAAAVHRRRDRGRRPWRRALRPRPAGRPAGRVMLSVPPAELLRRLVKAVLEHTAHELHDDTTLVLVQRRDGHPT